MGLAALVKRAAALLVAAGLSAFLVAGISADDGNEEAAATRVLQPTQVVAEIPEGYNELFELQWGGGSLYQLKGRLATMGCIANTIWLYDNDQWNVYNQYNIPQDNPAIQQFKQQYEQFIPAGTLWADCYRICEFTQTRSQYYNWWWIVAENNMHECLSFEHIRDKGFYNFIQYPIDKTILCTNDFDSRVKETVFPNLPLHPDVCIVKQKKGFIAGSVLFGTINATPFIVVYTDINGPYRSTKERDVLHLKNEIHELCHINQAWQWIQGVHVDTEIGEDWLANHYRYNFYHSKAGKEFIDMVGFTNVIHNIWRLPTNTIYHDIYNKNPIELSAELCTMYLLDKMGERNSYDYETYGSGKYYEIPIRTIDVNTYLTPEIREWLETWMILPEIIEEDAE